MAPDLLRFHEGAAARREDAPQGPLEAVLLMLREDEPPWATINAILHERVSSEGSVGGTERWKAWSRMLTALHTTAAKCAHAARQAGKGADDEAPAITAMRAQGWEPFPELGLRLNRQAAAGGWGSPTTEEGEGGVLRMTWDVAHAEGRQAGKPRRALIALHAGNAGWARITWASWREGQAARKASERTVGEAMGVVPGEAFPAREDKPVPGGGSRFTHPASDEDAAERDAIEADA